MHGEAKFFVSFVPVDCLHGSDSLVTDKCQQVSHKPSSFLFGMLDTKEGISLLWTSVVVGAVYGG